MEKIKITFTGDIMSHQPMYEEFRKNKKFYEIMLEPINSELAESDYLVGNLETPISRYFGYTNDRYCFNTPKQLLKALKKSNFNLLCTANNHCLDRGIIGLKQTMKNIKKSGMSYVGTSFVNENPAFITEIDGVKIGFLAYTYGTNYSYNHFPINEKKIKIKLLKNQASNPKWKKYKAFNGYMILLKKYVKAVIKKIIKYKKQVKNNNTINNIIYDELNKGEWILDKDKISIIKKDVNDLKCDLKFLILHMGGQYNNQPGTFSKEILNNIKDVKLSSIIGHHPHCVQGTYTINDIFGAYSLGNFCFSTNTTNIGYESKPEYSILLHYYIDTTEKKITDISFSILKSICEEGQIKVFNTYDLYKKNPSQVLLEDIKYIHKLFSNNEWKLKEPKKEYELK